MTHSVVLRRRGTTPEVLLVPVRGEGALNDRAVHAVRQVTGLADVDVWAVDLSRPDGLFAADVPGVPDVPDVPDAHGAAVSDADAGAHRWQRPEDLADERARTAASIPSVRLGFRPMSRADFRDVVGWQAQPHVARWWSEEARDEAGAEAHYGPALDGQDPTRMWVLELNGRSVGMVQDYLVGDHPDWALLTARPDAVGFDYLVGDPSWVGNGTGTRLLWTYLRDVVRPHYPDAREYFASPDHLNAASLRVLDKLGFTRGLWFDEPQPGGRVDTLIGCTLDVPGMFGPAPEVTAR